MAHGDANKSAAVGTRSAHSCQVLSSAYTPGVCGDGVVQQGEHCDDGNMVTSDDGAHPTINEGVVDRQVCFHWSSNECNWNSNIQVVNSGSYDLVEPGPCRLRDCGADAP
jgi:cysteine-rich repeat protein